MFDTNQKHYGGLPQWKYHIRRSTNLLPPDVWTALNNLPQRVGALLKKYESSNAGGFEDFERELHALFAQTQCAVTEEALARHECGPAVRVHRRRDASPGLSLRPDLPHRRRCGVGDAHVVSSPAR